MIAARLGIAGLAVLLYVVACAAPALQFDQIENAARGPNIMKGYEAALLGWQALFVGNFGWIANLPFVVGLVFLLSGSWRPAAVCSGIALLVALDSLLHRCRRRRGDPHGPESSTSGLLFLDREHCGRVPRIALATAGEPSPTLSQPFLRARFTYLKTRSQKPAVPAINASMPAK